MPHPRIRSMVAVARAVLGGVRGQGRNRPAHHRGGESLEQQRADQHQGQLPGAVDRRRALPRVGRGALGPPPQQREIRQRLRSRSRIGDQPLRPRGQLR